MTNDKKNVYYVNIKNNLIDSFTIDNEVRSKFDGEVKEYPIETFQAFVGVNINHIHSDGSLLSLKELIKKGYTILKENEMYDEEKNEVREKTQIEIYKENPDSKELSKMHLKVNDVGDEELVEKTHEEKYKEKLITKEEYNENINSLRKNEYNKFDAEQIKLIREFMLGIKTQDEVKKEFQKIQHSMDIGVKKKYVKVSKNIYDNCSKWIKECSSKLLKQLKD